MNTTGRRPWLAAALSFLCPGLGQLYCGRIVRGLVLFLLSLFFAPVTLLVAFALPADGLLYALVGACAASAILMVFAVVDAWRIARPLRTEFAPREYQRPVVYAMFLLAGVVVPGCTTVVVTTHSFATYKIAADSMAPTLRKGDRILVNKLRFEHVAVKRGDVVVFRSQGGDVTYVKRVVGLPGDRVEVRGGRVLVNDQALPLAPADGVPRIGAGAGDDVRIERNGGSSYGVLVGGAPTDASDAPSVLVPPESFYLLGDHRGASMDSRTFGPVARGDIVGRAEYVFTVFDSWSRVGAVSGGK